MSLRFLFALLCGLSLSFPAMAQPTLVLTTIKPLQQIAAAVLDGIDTPQLLLQPGASPHSYALRPSDRRALLEAQRVYWVGPEMERFLQKLLAERAEALALMEAPGVKLRLLQQRHEFDHGHGDDEHNHHADEHHHGHDGHDHAPGTIDAHIWLDPDNAVAIARLMASDLATFYPGREAQLLSNLATFEQRIKALDTRLQARLKPLQGKPWFAFHDGYGYLEDHYGIKASGIFTLSHEVQPGARHVNQLRQQLQATGRSCVFSEPQFTPRLINSLTQGLEVESGELDPLGGHIEVSARGYEQSLEDVAGQLAGCLERL